MAVRCSKCGEELLGPVNRCWKCGQTFATLPDAGGVPPIRREVPAVSEAPASAVPLTAAASTSGALAASSAPASADQSSGALTAVVLAGPATGQLRTGSPFGPSATMTPAGGQPLAAGARPKAPPTQQLIRDHAAVAGAVGSLVLGAFGLGVAWMANPTAVIGAASIAILGLVMGMWGLHSQRRGWALFGMLLCVAAISLASYSGAMLVYEAQLEAKEMEGQLAE